MEYAASAPSSAKFAKSLKKSQTQQRKRDHKFAGKRK
jgi:hypothetical protein